MNSFVTPMPHLNSLDSSLTSEQPTTKLNNNPTSSDTMASKFELLLSEIKLHIMEQLPDIQSLKNLAAASPKYYGKLLEEYETVHITVLRNEIMEDCMTAAILLFNAYRLLGRKSEKGDGFMNIDKF